MTVSFCEGGLQSSCFSSTVTQVHPAAPVELLEIRQWDIVCVMLWPHGGPSSSRPADALFFVGVLGHSVVLRQRSERPMGLMLPLVMLHPWELPQRGARTGQLIADKGLTPMKWSQGHLTTWRDSESLVSYYMPDITCYCLDNNNYEHHFNW